MKIIGLTGGIGSGKTTVANLFAALGVPIYIADVEAKKLMGRSKVIKRKLTALLGEEAYINHLPNRPFIASKIFNNTVLLAKTNAIIHPKVASHFKRWAAKQKAVYCIKEAAILFENGSYKKCDATILVTAPREVRISRVLKRDSTTKKEILERMMNQWDDAKKLELADYNIENLQLEATKEAVLKMHNKLIEKYR